MIQFGKKKQKSEWNALPNNGGNTTTQKREQKQQNKNDQIIFIFSIYWKVYTFNWAVLSKSNLKLKIHLMKNGKNSSNKRKKEFVYGKWAFQYTKFFDKNKGVNLEAI